MTFRIRGIQRWLAIAAILAGCSQDRSAGGGGFEGETISVSGRIVLSGRGLARADVAFIALSTGRTVQRTTTDDSGDFDLRLPAGSSGFLEARSGDTALVRTLLETLPSRPLALEASVPVPWNARATIAGQPVSGATVREMGSALRAACDAQGRFTLLRTRATTTSLIALDLPDGTTRTAPLPSLADSVVDFPDHSQVLLDDFDDGDARTALGTAIGSGWWFVVDDASEGGASAVLPAEAIGDVRQAFATTDAWSGTSLSLRFLISQQQPVFYGLVGAVVADETHWLDFSKLDSITFMAKGSGSVRLVLATRHDLQPTLDSVGYFGFDFELPASWSRVTVRASDILAAAGSRADQQGIAWSTASREIRNVGFSVQDTATIQIDDIVLHGPAIADLVGDR